MKVQGDFLGPPRSTDLLWNENLHLPIEDSHEIPPKNDE